MCGCKCTLQLTANTLLHVLPAAAASRERLERDAAELREAQERLAAREAEAQRLATDCEVRTVVLDGKAEKLALQEAALASREAAILEYEVCSADYVFAVSCPLVSRTPPHRSLLTTCELRIMKVAPPAWPNRKRIPCLFLRHNPSFQACH